LNVGSPSIDRRIDDELNDIRYNAVRLQRVRAERLTQIDEDQSPVIASPVDPSGESDPKADIGDRQC
jgi:hypothetical protein